MVTNSDAARQLAALRKTKEKTCPICGTVFMAYGKQEYDKKACANKASYRRVGRAPRRPHGGASDG
jgi:tRNA(Ile2) C34 agmatinyltransferase TiaS